MRQRRMVSSQHPPVQVIRPDPNDPVVRQRTVAVTQALARLLVEQWQSERRHAP